MVTIESTKTPIYGLADKSNKDIPFSYIFLPPRKMWPDVSARMMKDKVENNNNIELILVLFIKQLQ